MNHSNSSRTKFPLISPSSNHEEIIYKMNSHLTLLEDEKNSLIALGKILREDDLNDRTKLKYQSKRKLRPKRNSIKSRTTLVASSYPKTFFRAERKTKTIQTKNAILPMLPCQSIFNFTRQERKIRTLNDTSLNKTTKGNSLFHKIANEEKKTNETATKLQSELTSLRNMKYFSQERFELKSTIDDKTLFKRMYCDDKTKKSYVKNLNGKEVISQSHQISNYTPLQIFSNRKLFGKRLLNFGETIPAISQVC